MRRRTRIAIGAGVAVAAAVLALLIAALVGPSRSELASAADRLQAQNTSGTIAIGLATTGDTLSVSGRYVQNARGNRGQLTGSVTIPSGRVVAMQARFLGDDLWLRYPGLRGALPPGYRWIHMLNRTSGPESMTPSQFARFLTDADSVRKVDDDEPIDGRPTAHYRGLVDFEDVAKEIGGQTEQRFERIFRGADVELPVEAWIRRDGLPRRIRISGRFATGSVDMTLDILRYGVAVAVRPPPSGSVIEERDWQTYTGRRSTS